MRDESALDLIRRLKRDFPDGIDAAEVHHLNIQEIVAIILEGISVDIAPVFPPEDKEETVSLALSMILAFERDCRNSRKVYASFLFSAYVLKRFGDCE